MKLIREKEPRNRCREGSRHPMEKRRREPLAAAFFRKTEELFGPQIQLLGNRELLIEGCRSVEACDENLIRLRLPGLLLMVLGEGLQVGEFAAESLSVRGKIRSLELETEGKKGK